MRSQLTTALRRLDARIEREILRLRARYQLSLDEFRGLYISDEHVDKLVADARVPAPIDESALVARPAAGVRDSDERWRHLVDVFDLSVLDEDLLLIAGAPELDLKYETLYAYLNNDVTRKWPTADLAHRLLADVADVSAVLGALAPTARLYARHLIQRIAQPAGRPALLNAGYALHPCIAHWLHGQPAATALDSSFIAWTLPTELPEQSAAARRRAAPLVRLLRARDSRHRPVVALLGQAGSGRSSTAIALASATGRPLARLDLHVAAQAGNDVAEALDRLRVVLEVSPAVILIQGFDAPSGDEHQRPPMEVRLKQALAHWPTSSLVLFRTDDEERWRTYAGARRIVEIKCDVESFADRVAQWNDAARDEGVDVPEADLEGLAGRFAFATGQVRATFATARDLATMDGAGEVSPELVGTAARLTSDRALGRLATKVERKHDWSDLVLPAETLGRLRELAAAIRHRHVVYDEWGFGARILHGAGIKTLFAGSSGTGKTMAAGVIARELGLDLYRVDLSGVVSKYIGETEKNLDRIFRAARAAHAIVFLDEAEAIMGKRSEVKDAHDRYANIEVAYLLQKLEDHDGVVILATNLKGNIDDAFSRRVQYVIDFPRPEEAERERIWRGMFPANAPLGADVDFAFLARQFELAGGDIRNVALDAAFLAVQNAGVIGMKAVVEALARQLAKEGKTLTGSDFRQYQQLVHTGG